MLRIGIDIDNTITNTSNLANNLLKNDINFNGYFDYHNLSKSSYILFLNKYLDYIEKNVELNKNVVSVLNYLHERGCYIVLITARGSRNFKNTEVNTLNYLKNKNICYDKIIFKQESKLKVSQEEKIDVFIDDKIKVLDEMNNKNILTIKFGKCDKKIKHKVANNWLEVKKIIDDLLNNK